MKSQKVSSTKNSKCGSANKHVKINRNLPQKKNPTMSSPLTDSYSKSYLAAMAFCIQKFARPILLTHEKYLAVSIRVLQRSGSSPRQCLQNGFLRQHNCICDLLHLQKVSPESWCSLLSMVVCGPERRVSKIVVTVSQWDAMEESKRKDKGGRFWC